MKKILYFFIFLIIVSSVMAVGDLCKDIEKQDYVNCTILSPYLSECSIYNYSITNINGTIEKVDLLENYGEGKYKFTFNESIGIYLVKFCNNATQSIQVREDTMLEFYTTFLVMLAIIFIFVIVAHIMQNYLMYVFAGVTTLAMLPQLRERTLLINQYFDGSLFIMLAIVFFYIASKTYKSNKRKKFRR